MTTDRDVDDPIDERVRAARPVAPAGLAPAVAARIAARRSLRNAAIGAGTLLAAAAVVLVWLHGGRDAPTAPRPAITLHLDAGTVLPVDAATLGWSDMPRMLAERERAHDKEITACLAGRSARELATFRIERRPDGSSWTHLVIHHSLGYLGYSSEERCLQRLESALAMPALPDGLLAVAFTLAPAPEPTDDRWRDPLQTARSLLEPVRERIDACARGGVLAGALAVFEPDGGPYRHGTRGGARARIVLADGTPAAVRRCVADIARALEVPPLPADVDQIEVALAW